MRVLIALLLSIVVVGCATSGYQQYYKAFLAQDPSDLEFLADSASPKIYLSDDLARDIRIMQSKGFVGVGSSSFNGQIGSEKQIEDQARRVKATMVLVNSKYTGTLTQTVPLFLPDVSTTYSHGSVYGTGGYGTYSGTSTTYGSTVVPMTTQQQRYDQTAVFLVKSKRKMKFGVFLHDLTPELQASLERNTGALVTAVREDSPAFLANILPGDILIEIDGITIRNAQQALQVMKEANPTGGKCNLKIIRKGGEKIILIQFAQ